jgi:hypothetical protein
LRASSATSRCEGETQPIAQNVVAPNEPLFVSTTAEYVCIVRTFAPFTAVGWSYARTVRIGGAAVRVSLPARETSEGAPAITPTPVTLPLSPKIAPLVLELAGKTALHVRVTAGACSASPGEPLFTGLLRRDQPLAIPNRERVLCVQSRAPLANVWDEGRTVRRLVRCTATKIPLCTPDVTKPWKLIVPARAS